MPVLTNTIVNAAGLPVPGAAVQIELAGRWASSGAQEVLAGWSGVTDAAGVWAISLPAQSSYEGSTYYTVREPGVTWAATVADAPSTQRLRDRLTTPVPAATVVGLALDGLADVAAAAPISGQVLSWNGSLWVPAAAGGGVTDHGALTGLGDDDHTQYHTDARGDARYPPQSRLIIAGTGLTGGGSLATDRTLAVVYGTIAGTAAQGNDARLSDSRTPTGAATGSLSGTYPAPGIAAGAVGSAEIATAIKDPAAGTAGLRTLGTGAQQAAAGNDARMSDSRTPLAHAASHASGGSDPVTPIAIGAATSGHNHTGTYAAAGHDARGVYPASAAGYLTWTMDPGIAGISYALPHQVLIIYRVRIAEAVTISTLHTALITPGATPGAYSGMALYTDSGNLLSATPDAGSDFSTGVARILNLPLALAQARPAASFARIALLWQGGTPPIIAGLSQVSPVLTNAGVRRSVFLAAQTAFPASIDIDAANLDSTVTWAAAS